jgi:hypothetical protein
VGTRRIIAKTKKYQFEKKVMNTRPIIQSLWIGESLSNMEKLCISSFLKNGHPFHLYVYDEVKGVPEGTILKDASEILPPNMIFKYKDHDSYAGFANLFRYKLLLEKGCYWVDTDIICLEPFQQRVEYIFAGEKIYKQNNAYKATNCIIYVPIGSTIMDYCFTEAMKKEPDKLQWGETGPNLLTFAIKKFDMVSYVANPSVFCPVDWWSWYQLIEESSNIEMLKASRSVHLWNEMWRRNNINKSGNFPENSIYEQLKRRYLIE